MTPAGEQAGAWRVSSHSNFNGNCAEVTGWRKSSASNGTNCAEAAATACGVAVRDSKDRGGPVLLFGPAAWAAFTRQVKRMEA